MKKGFITSGPLLSLFLFLSWHIGSIVDCAIKNEPFYVFVPLYPLTFPLQLFSWASYLILSYSFESLSYFVCANRKTLVRLQIHRLESFHPFKANGSSHCQFPF